MHRSLQITFSRRGLLLAAIGLAALLAGPALAIDRPAASFYTPQQLEAISQSWAARGGVFVDRPAASFYTPQQLEAISQSWAARGGVFVDRPAASFYTPQQLEAISQSWAARGRHASSTLRSSSGLDWSDSASEPAPCSGSCSSRADWPALSTTAAAAACGHAPSRRRADKDPAGAASLAPRPVIAVPRCHLATLSRDRISAPRVQGRAGGAGIAETSLRRR